jgi:hypothetical protein
MEGLKLLHKKATPLIPDNIYAESFQTGKLVGFAFLGGELSIGMIADLRRSGRLYMQLFICYCLERKFT